MSGNKMPTAVAAAMFDPVTGRYPNAVFQDARKRPCRNCRAMVWAGLDDDPGGAVAFVDRDRLSVIGELKARLDGRSTYRLRGTIVKRIYLDYRDSFRIADHDADQVIVVAEHRCGQPIPMEWT
jgi:hypothetical protein